MDFEIKLPITINLEGETEICDTLNTLVEVFVAIIVKTRDISIDVKNLDIQQMATNDEIIKYYKEELGWHKDKDGWLRPPQGTIGWCAGIKMDDK